MGRRRRWPAYVTAVVSLIGVAIAIAAWNTSLAQPRTTIAVCGFGLVVIVGTVMLFIQRVSDVGVARLSGTPLISSFDLFDKGAFALLLIASISNGIVVALEVARR